MRCTEHSGVDKRIKTLDADLRASKTKMVESLQTLALRGDREKKGGPQHDDQVVSVTSQNVKFVEKREGCGERKEGSDSNA